MTHASSTRTTPFLAAAIVALLGIGNAPAYAQTLEEALAVADTLSGVVTAQLELGDARREAERTEADPLALRIDRLQADQAYVLAQARVRGATFDAYVDVAEAYLQAVVADKQVGLARVAADLSERALDIANIRLERGAATDLDVRDAVTALDDARATLATAEQGAALARASLVSLIGGDIDALALTEPDLSTWWTDLPDEEVLVAQLDAAPTLLGAVQGLELATVALDLLDPSYAPARQIDGAEAQRARAEEGVREARRGLALLVRSLLDRVASAREAWTVAEQALADAEERERVERSRLDAGLISDIAFQQSVLATMQARTAATQARNDVILALLRLQADSGIGLEGLDAF